MEDYDEQYKCRGCLTKDQFLAMTNLGYSPDEILLMQLGFSENEIVRLEDGAVLIKDLESKNRDNIT